MANVFEGLGHGVLNWIGLGSLYDPIGDAQKEAVKVKDQLQTTIANGSYQAFLAQNKINTEFYQYLQSQTTNVYQMIEYYNSISSQKLETTNYVLALTFMMIFLLIMIELIVPN